ncbi:protein of unknown function [Paenibacillus alvei]|uniref:Uncharacterized protein n=1 Tax=Paenibacillus alvei TaxID=44250 RepID=A0A383R5G9_PAEAL|nr:protein of unknown function [Paenibacillus alvei]
MNCQVPFFHMQMKSGHAVDTLAHTAISLSDNALIPRNSLYVLAAYFTIGTNYRSKALIFMCN